MQKALRTAENVLQNSDPVIARLIDRHGPCMLFSDNSLVHKPHFHVLVWAIINQQLSVASARSIENKLAKLLQAETFELEAMHSLRDRQLASCGISKQKISYIRTLCRSVGSGEIRLEKLARQENEQVFEALTTLRGIGPWTVDMFLMFSLGRLDVLPLGDLALRKSIAHHYELPEQAALDQYHAIADRWRPYRTVSSWYLWAAVD
ncbi:MAG: DNA-3-methyladenine glycosylase 2 family protein [Gammaproteobacteria bacterium]|nr:DNA-3-methyladenine glycosylase 2 family protein [Gammaproteobacteria bacterium]